MIKAIIYDVSADDYKGFVIHGHSGMADSGYDLVCAAVSVLTQTALLGLDAYLLQKPKWKIDDNGYLECWLPEGLSDQERRSAQIVIHTMELGLKSIEKEYRKYLNVSKRRWNKCCSE